MCVSEFPILLSWTMSNQNKNNATHGRHASYDKTQSYHRPAPGSQGGGQPYGGGSQQPRQYNQVTNYANAAYGSAPQGGFTPDFHQRPRRKVGKVLGITFGCIFLVLASVYCGVAIYFGSHFMPNTKLGSLDASLMSSSEVEQRLTDNLSSYKLAISGQGFDLTVSAKDMGLSIDSAAVVKQALGTINNWAWPIELTRSHDITETVVSTYNNSGFEQTIVSAVNDFNATAEQPVNATVAYDKAKKTFSVSKESVGTALDAAKVVAAADKAIADLSTKVTLTSSELLQPTVLSSDARLATAAADANKMITADIKLTMGTSTAAEVNSDIISEWISIDGDLAASLDEDAMRTWIEDLASKCNTVGTTRTYTRADGKSITVSGGVYGWAIDSDALVDMVIEGVKAGSVETQEVPYSSCGETYNGVGGRDWGNRYIDIDLAEQHVYFYDDSGTCVWESDCISGIPDGTHDTSVGVYWINAMASPSKLIGYENGEKIYESTVQYWMPFDGNAIGLHDADWQPSFGGTMYADGYGSHGCVNLPPSAAAELYGLIHSGDCVVSHW